MNVVKLSPDAAKALDGYASATGRKKNWVVSKALLVWLQQQPDFVLPQPEKPAA